MSEKDTFEVGTEVVAIRDVDQALFGNYRATISKGDRGVVVSIGNRLLVKWGAGKQLYIGAADVEPADPGLPSPLAPTATDEAWIAEIRARVVNTPEDDLFVKANYNEYYMVRGVHNGAVFADVPITGTFRSEIQKGYADFIAVAPNAVRRLLDALDIYVEREGHYNARLDAKDKTLEAQSAAQQQRIEALEKALEPFANMGDIFINSKTIHPSYNGQDREIYSLNDAVLTRRDFERAYEALHADEEGA